jgi:hypothetical protein
VSPACYPTSPLPTTDAGAAAVDLASARRELEDAAATLRLAADLTWDSAAGDTCRNEISQVLGALDTAAGTLDQAAVVVRAGQA